MNQFNLSDGTYFRYSERGEGPCLLLLHTIRNRIEYYDRLSPLLIKKFKVICIELPGHGDSPINKKTNYNIEFITNSIVEFIDQKQLEDITIAGESIGAVLASTVAIKIPSKVEKVYCFNPYDYDTKFGEGVSRGNFISKFLFLLCEYSHLPSIGNKSFNLSTAVLKPSWIPHEVENNSY